MFCSYLCLFAWSGKNARGCTHSHRRHPAPCSTHRPNNRTRPTHLSMQLSPTISIHDPTTFCPSVREGYGRVRGGNLNRTLTLRCLLFVVGYLYCCLPSPCRGHLSVHESSILYLHAPVPIQTKLPTSTNLWNHPPFSLLHTYVRILYCMLSCMSSCIFTSIFLLDLSPIYGQTPVCLTTVHLGP